MTELSYNSEKTAMILSEKVTQIAVFQEKKQKITLSLEQHAELTYAIFLKNAEIQLTIIAKDPAVKAQIFAFIPAQQASHTSLQVKTFLQASHTKVNVHLIAIQEEEANLKMQGEINIASWIEKISGHLLEEVVLLGNAKYTSLQPVLNVASPDVQASHGAKVHRIPLEKLFYMQSRGLSSSVALTMIVEAYVQQILGHFELSDEEKEKIYSFIQ